MASREPLLVLPSPHAPKSLDHRWLELSLPDLQARLLELSERICQDFRDERAMIVGDFNTGLPIDAEGTPFVYSEKMAELLDIGWVDAWRQMNSKGKEYTWYSIADNGFRLDYAFASPKMNGSVKEVYHSHQEREEGHSDHSMLVVTLD